MKKLTTGQTIRIIRMQLGIKQGELEKTLAMARGRLGKIEIHNADLMVSTFEAICKELKTSPEEFFKIKRGLL